MIYDDQPQMVKAVGAARAHGLGTVRNATILRKAFVAIDREALIEKVYTDRRARGYEHPEDFLRLQIEKDFVAAGILSEES